MKATSFRSGQIGCILVLLAAMTHAALADPGLQQQIPPAEYAALVDFYNSTQGQNWSHNDGWNDPTAPSWYGVTVSGFQYDSETGQILSLGNVTELGFFANNLSGNIPESLGNLMNLRSLNFSWNSLAGSIPDTLGKLVNLQWLVLEANQLSGSSGASRKTFGTCCICNTCILVRTN
jgi:hypothetical protein